MKHKIFTAAASLAMLFTVASCDNISMEERFVQVERPVAAKTYLIQEFTGQNCTNCPEGAQAMHGILEQYGDAVIAVCLHPKGAYYNTQMGPIVLVSEVAKVYYDYFKPKSFPAAVIDGGRPNTSYSSWSGSLDKLVKNAEVSGLVPPAGILLDAVYDPDTKKLDVDYNVYFTETYGSQASLVLWVVENDIVTEQLTMNGKVKDYVHNHVLRCAMNGDWGTQLQSVLSGTSNHGTVSCTLQQDWNAENCQIVGYLFDTSSKSGIQAAQIKLPAGRDNTVGN